MSTPASRARRPASAREAATPCAWSSATEVQSLTTNPANPHSPRSTVSNSQRLTVLGTPAMSLNDVMMLPTPASTAALKGDRYTSLSARSETSTVL